MRNGIICGIGKAGNPDVMDNVHPDLVIGSSTEVIAGEKLIVTAGAIDAHVHYICPQQVTEALASGTTTILFFTLIFAVLRRLRSWVRHRKANPLGLPYPPGPKPLPLLGNLLDVPSSYYWLRYSDWAKKYGDINHIRVFGQHTVILNSIEACTDLLEKRSAKYSDRPRFPMMNELYVSQYNVF